MAINPEWKMIGPDFAFQVPVLGEFLPTFTEVCVWFKGRECKERKAAHCVCLHVSGQFMKGGGGLVVDVVTWHWVRVPRLLACMHAPLYTT